jgi:hypothetical protein
MLCTPMQAAPETAHSLLDNHCSISQNPENGSPEFCRRFVWDAPILFTRLPSDNIRKVLRLHDLFQCHPAADHQRRAFQLH